MAEGVKEEGILATLKTPTHKICGPMVMLW